MAETRELIAEAIWNTCSDGEDWVPWDDMPSRGLPHECLLNEADAIIEVLREHGKEIVDGAQVCGLCHNCKHFMITDHHSKSGGKLYKMKHRECQLGHWDELMPNWGCVDFEPRVTDD